MRADLKLHLFMQVLIVGSALRVNKTQSERHLRASRGVPQSFAHAPKAQESARNAFGTPSYWANFWESDKDATIRKYPWPELQQPYDLKNRTCNIGVAISGGGTRSYAAGYGQLRALHHLGYLKKTRYLAGISAGAEIVAAYVYHQTGKDDGVLLGENPDPSSLTLDVLDVLPSSSLGFGATVDGGPQTAAGALLNAGCRTFGALLPAWVCGDWGDAGHIWTAVMAKVLKPYGLDTSSFFAMDEQTRDKILSANPGLQASDFILPAATDRPYMIIGITGAGPIQEDCLKLPSYTADYAKCLLGSAKRFQRIEATPLYSGFPLDRNLSVVYADGSTADARVGGLVESFAFNGAAPTELTLTGIEGTKGLVAAPEPERRWTLLEAVAAGTNVGSNYWYEYDGAWTRPGPGNSVSTGYSFIDRVFQPFGTLWPGSALISTRLNTWNTGDSQPDTHLIGTSDGVYDGALLGLSDLVVRGVSTAVTFLNSDIPLCPSSMWDPHTMTSHDQVLACIDHYVARLFGLGGTQDVYGDFDRSVEQLQMFSVADFAPFVAELQENARTGSTAVAKRTMTTVKNEYLGISAGSSIELVLFYLSSSEEFESALPTETQEEISKGENGQFTKWPFFNTILPNDPMQFDPAKVFQFPPESPLKYGYTSLTTKQTNLLSALSSWAVNQNDESILRDVFEECTLGE